jgi:hypothetical protein
VGGEVVQQLELSELAELAEGAAAERPCGAQAPEELALQLRERRGLLGACLAPLRLEVDDHQPGVPAAAHVQPAAGISEKISTRGNSQKFIGNITY